MSESEQSRRAAILEAARRLFGRQGYDATTMDEVAAAAGVAKATLYRYVGGKEGLRDLLAPELPEADLRARDARGAILEATIDLVARQGLGRTSLEEIAAAAGVSRGAIYWHFKNKDDLFAAIISDLSPLPYITALLREAGDVPLEELARQIAGLYLDFIGERIDFLRAILVEVPANPELLAVFQRHIAGPLVIHLLTREALERGFGLSLSHDEVVETFLTIYFNGMRMSRE